MFGCVADQVLYTAGTLEFCYYNNYSACSFAIAVGVIGFLLSLAFIVKDILIVIIDYSDNPVVSHYFLSCIDKSKSIVMFCPQASTSDCR